MTNSALCLFACIALAAAAGCASLPETVQRTPTRAYADTTDTRLGRSLGPPAAANVGKTGVLALPNGRDAFAARVLLARAAERSLDVQYYIWHRDTSGGLLALALWEAAERGVRVRMLLDDANTQRLDDMLATLDGHPNIEVRLFNPFANRSWRIADFATDFSRVNRRMHNKSFTADNQVAIVGGRNIGDEYLGADSAVEFADLDVVTTGALVSDVSADFDAYWNSPPAYPASAIIAPVPPETATRVREEWAALRQSPKAAAYITAVRDLPLVSQVLAGTVPFEWVAARLVSDDPLKVVNPPERKDLQMVPRLQRALGTPVNEVLIVSPYFVPTSEGTAALLAHAQRGVSIRVLTNSLASSDVAPVYAGYSNYRQELLRGGVRLYELKGKPQEDKDREHDPAFGSRGGSSGASLHTKAFGVDKRRIFVGSFNFDPRSARLNTEMGVVMESATLATQLSDVFDRKLSLVAYEVRMADDGQSVIWIDRTGPDEIRLVTAPEAGLLKRMWIGFLSILPIEWLL
jgi:putative cardiolipin synthase